jgi:hypothetical protein
VPTDVEIGILTGLLIGEGHFGGDGRQPHATLRMHVRHEPLFRWLERTFPGGRLYGPYSHGGREYFQWMARGAYLRDELLPRLEKLIDADLDAYTSARIEEMRARYAGRLGPRAEPGDSEAATGSANPTGGIGYVTTGGRQVSDPQTRLTAPTGD